MVGTSPDVGSNVEEGTEVTLFISDGPGKAVAPNEVGKTLSDAKSDLRSNGFRYSINYVDAQPNQAPDTVLGQTPSEGETVNKGSTVTLTVAKAPAQPSDPFPSFTPPGAP